MGVCVEVYLWVCVGADMDILVAACVSVLVCVCAWVCVWVCVVGSVCAPPSPSPSLLGRFLF